MKLKRIYGAAILALMIIAASWGQLQAQDPLLQKKDSLVVGVDTISVITPGGLYGYGAFTIVNTTDTVILAPQARYFGSSEWVTISVKNTKTQTSDTTILSRGSSWPTDYIINDPCIVGFRLVKTNAYKASVKAYIYYRFRRDY